MRLICSGVFLLRFMGILLTKSGRWGSFHKGWFSFRSPRQFRTALYRPGDPSRPFADKEEACQWAAAFVDWYGHEHRHSAIRIVTGSAWELIAN